MKNKPEWYEIDVKKRTLEALWPYLDAGLRGRVWKSIDSHSVRDLMEAAFWAPHPQSDFLARKTAQIYYSLREAKYSTAAYWHDAVQERKIAYGNKWEDFINSLLKEYAGGQGKILFVGAANGAEVPENGNFVFHAADQLLNSVRNMDNPNIAARFVGDFEDSDFAPCGKQDYDGLVALRCLTPNARLDKFMRFGGNNLRDDGVLILSYPLAYLRSHSNLVPIEDINAQIEAFQERLTQAATEAGFRIQDEIKTELEHFWILYLKKGCPESS